eukprot:746521-Pelagomonas_calceolata.AAC.1
MFGGVAPPEKEQFEYLSMLVDKHMNLKVSEELAVQPYMAAQQRVKECMAFRLRCTRAKCEVPKIYEKAVSSKANCKNIGSKSLHMPQQNYTFLSLPSNLSMRVRNTSSRPDAILVIPCNAQPTSDKVSSSCSHHVLRSRHGNTQRADIASQVRQCHQLHASQRHVYRGDLIEIKYCEETRPRHQLDTAKQQHADLCKLISAKAVTIHPILLG